MEKLLKKTLVDKTKDPNSEIMDEMTVIFKRLEFLEH